MMHDFGMVLLITGLIGFGPTIGALMVAAGRGRIDWSLRFHHGIVVAHFIVLAILGIASMVQSSAVAPEPITHSSEVAGTPESDPGASSADSSVRTPEQRVEPDRDVAAGTTPRSPALAAPVEQPAGTPLRIGNRNADLDSGVLGLLRAAARSVGEAVAPVAALGVIISLFVVGISLRRLHGLELACRVNAKTSVRDRVTVYESDHVRIPFTCGAVRPRIYLPSRSPSSSGPGAAVRASHNAYLRHEMAHVDCSDILWNTLEQLLRVLLWFSPVVHLLARRGRLLREMRADRIAARESGRAEYASTLIAVAESVRLSRRASAFAIPIAENSRRLLRQNALQERVKTVLHGARPRSFMSIVSSGGVAVGVLLLVAGCVTPGVQSEYLGLPLVGYSVETRDDNERPIRREWYSGDTRERERYSEFRYFEDNQGRVTQYVTTWRDGAQGPYAHGTRLMISDPRIETPVTRYHFDASFDPERMVPWPSTWELHDDEGRLVRVYVVDYHDRHSDLVGDPLRALRVSYDLTYGADGSSTATRLITAPGFPWQHLEQFDAEGNKIESWRLADDGRPIRQTSFQYDSNGRVVRSISRDESGETIEISITTTRPDGTVVQASYREGDYSTTSDWPSRGGGLGGPWTTVAGGAESGLRISVLERDHGALAPQPHEAIANSFVVEALGNRDRAVAILKNTIRGSYFTGHSPDETLDETVDLVFRVTSDGVRVVGPSERFTPRELFRDRIAQEIAFGTGYATALENGDAEDLTYLVEISLVLRYDPATGLHWVEYPEGVNEMLEDPVPAPVQRSAPVADLLPSTTERFLGNGVDTVIMDITVTPDGTVVDPSLVYAAPEQATPVMEARLIDQLWGGRLQPTGLPDDAVITLRVAGDRHAGGNEAVVVSSADARLARWFELLRGE